MKNSGMNRAPVAQASVSSPDRLETARLSLVPLSRDQLTRVAADPGGVAASFGAVSGPYRFLEMLAKRRIFLTKADILRCVPAALGLTTMWLLVDKVSRRVVGEAGFKGPPQMSGVEIGYYTREFARGNGYMTEAVGALCRYAFAQREFPLDRVLAATRPDNVASHRVLEKNGFVRSGWAGGNWSWVLSSPPCGEEHSHQSEMECSP